VVWRRGNGGPWIFWGSLAIPDDIDADDLIKEVLSRLPEPVAENSKERVYLKLATGLSR
jgi:hypothetical protein